MNNRSSPSKFLTSILKFLKFLFLSKSFDLTQLVEPNLPKNCCVEVPCEINSKGYIPQKIGDLPEQLSALMRTNINVQILTAEATITKKREHIYHAGLLDPLTSSNLSIDEIYNMVDELIEAHGNYLPNYI